MKKKIYLKPDVKVHQLRPTAILAGSNPQAKEANEEYKEEDPGWGWQ